MSKIEICKEMQKLRDGLTKKGIEWEDASEGFDSFFICRTWFTWKGDKWSVVNGFGTYGGVDFLSDKNHGLLEIWTSKVNGGSPLGFLFADDILEYLEKV